MIAGMSILIMVVPREKRGKYTSFAYSALGHSTLISPLLSGVMYDKLGQLWTFAIPGLATVVAGVVSIMVLSRLMISDDQRVPIPGPRQMLISAKSILLYPLSFVALVGIFSAGVSFGCFEVTVPPILADRLDVIKTNLMWSIGPLVFTVIAPLLGMLIDKIGPFLPFVTGVALYAVFYPFVYLMQDSLGGIGAVIAVMFGIEAILEMSVYPIMAAIVDARKPVATLTVAYSLNEVFIQAGYAIGNLVGVAIYEWRGLQALGYLLGPSNALLALVSIVVLKLFAKNKPDDLPLVDNKLPLSGAHSEA
jgi:predicted MFS family arabinose efflux permease